MEPRNQKTYLSLMKTRQQAVVPLQTNKSYPCLTNLRGFILRYPNMLPYSSIGTQIICQSLFKCSQIRRREFCTNLEISKMAKSAAQSITNTTLSQPSLLTQSHTFQRHSSPSNAPKGPISRLELRLWKHVKIQIRPFQTPKTVSPIFLTARFGTIQKDPGLYMEKNLEKETQLAFMWIWRKEN